MKDNDPNKPLTPEEGAMLTRALKNGYTYTGITRLGLQAIKHKHKAPSSSDRNQGLTWDDEPD